MSRRRLVFVIAGLIMAVWAPTYMATTALPMRSPALVDRASSIASRDRLPTPNESTSSITGPGTAVIARRVPAGKSRWPQAAPSQTAPDTPRRQISKVYPEYPQDALERGIQGTVVVDIVVNAAGDVSTAAIASGPQELRASAFKTALALKYTPASSTTAMKIAFQYTLTGNSWGVRIDNALTSGGTTNWSATKFSGAAAPPQVPANPDASGAYRIGGNIQAPKKLKDAPPVYPADAQEARVQGVVIMEVRLDENGSVSDVRTLRSIPLLDQAAIDAVKQWQYTPTLLNGVAVPVIMTVTVNFTLRQQAQIQLTLPDGSTSQLGMSPGKSMTIVLAKGRFQLQIVEPSDASSMTLSVFTEEGDHGIPTTHLGNVTLVLDGPVVQSPTTPSFGMQFLGFR